MSVIPAGHDGREGGRDGGGGGGGGGSPRLQPRAQPPTSGGGRTRDAKQQQQLRHHGGSMLKQPSLNEPADVVRRALDFKSQGSQCYKDKKYREAIGKYHRALLEMKGLCRLLGDPDPPSAPRPPRSAHALTDEQKGAMETAELECYNSLAGERERRRVRVVSAADTGRAHALRLSAPSEESQILGILQSS